MLKRGWPVVLLLPFVVPIPGALERIFVLRSLGVFAHFGLPLLLVALLYGAGPFAGRLLPAAGTAFVLAASCEFVQFFVGRHPRVQDAAVDLAGVLLFTGWILYRRGRRRRWLALMACCLAVLPFQLRKVPPTLVAMAHLRERMPRLDDFEDRATYRLWGQNDTKTGSYWVASPDDVDGSVLFLVGRAGETYPGVVLRGIPRDWSGYRRLVFDARVRDAESALLHVRLDDFAGRRDAVYCGGVCRIGPQWTRCEIDLAAAVGRVAGRTFRLDDLDSVLFFLDNPAATTVVQLDNLILE
jgi:hypothetical protein